MTAFIVSSGTADLIETTSTYDRHRNYTVNAYHYEAIRGDMKLSFTSLDTFRMGELVVINDEGRVERAS